MTEPAIERLRDALGVLRSVYKAAPDPGARRAIATAADEVKGALRVAQSPRQKELAGRLRNACRALEQAAQAAPWASPAILGALNRMPTMRAHH